jgi:hypothetical protein
MVVVLPALYVIAAELTACLVRYWGKAAGAIYLAVQTALMGQSVMDYYTNQMKEQWRDSAELVVHTAGCETSSIYVYGDAAFYRFFTKRVRPQLSLIEIPEGGSKDLSGEPSTSCPILLWVVGWWWNPDEMRERFGLSSNAFGVADFYAAWIVFRNEPNT